MTSKPLQPPDGPQRAQALDAARSFIVQAPAGSGKTELLIQRFLKLLGAVDAPEEVVAITFTRKAAGEMRLRVLQALETGALPDAPAQEHERTTWQLARGVVERDRSLGWGVAGAPVRLRIQTIDSLCASITRQMPWLSRFGGQPASSENAAHLYQKAAQATLAQVNSKGGGGEGGNGGGNDTTQAGPAVVRLLRHLDNNLARASELLRTMLARRDQWLRHVRTGNTDSLRTELERVLAELAGAGITRLLDAMPVAMRRDLPGLAAYAAENLVPDKPDDPIVACRGMASLPGTEPAGLPKWKGIFTLLLTNTGEVRKSVNKNQGFPAAGPAASADGKQAAGGGVSAAGMKGHMEGVLAAVSGDARLAGALSAGRSLPPATFPDAQWEVLQALLTLLPLAVRELRKVFAQAGEVDFTDVSLGALAALAAPNAGHGQEEQQQPLDYRIRHLLVDEFQDTSFSQMQLLERLTADWSEADGRTLFLVGDPMQSIYRFREADVSLYLRARRQGIGRVKLSPLNLSVNFRSQQGVVDWLNASFPQVFPESEDELSGAVPYNPCAGFHAQSEAPGVRIHPWLERNDREEAQRVVELVRQARESRPGGRVAVLVRSRGHLSEILPALKAAGLAFQAIDIDPLATRPAVQDLLALTRALHHPADRVAWLALLRAPWCGLQLADLLALVGDRPRDTVWDCMTASGVDDALSTEGRRRLTRVRDVLLSVLGAYPASGMGGMRDYVEGCWLALGGAAGLEANELNEARAFLTLLDELDQEAAAFDLAELNTRVERMFAPPDPAATAEIQIMSIHKAKGLQFDTVILPGMGRQPRRAEPSLLLWTELASGDGTAREMLLAPISETGEARDEIYDYVSNLHKTRDFLETARLLYVAVTRATEQVHLLGHVRVSGKGIRKPTESTLLGHLWPVVQDHFEQEPASAPGLKMEDTAQAAAATDGTDGTGIMLRRLEAGWELPPPPERAAGALEEPAAEDASAESEKREYIWAGDTARHIGTVVHRMLQRIAQEGAAGRDRAAISASVPAFRAELSRLGVPEAELEGGVEKVERAILQTLSDGKGSWLLGPHAQAEAELALTAVLDGKPVHVVIDRTFVDEEGLRWIVDYKTGSREGGDQEGYLDNEQKEYRPQLERYARILRKYDPAHPIRLMLYFPLMQASREWEPEPEPGTEAKP